MERAKNYNTFALFPPVQNKRNCSLDKNNGRQFGDGFAVHLRCRYDFSVISFTGIIAKKSVDQVFMQAYEVCYVTLLNSGLVTKHIVKSSNKTSNRTRIK